MSLPIIGNIITAIGNTIKVIFSGEEREKRYKTHIKKQKGMALNLAEEMFVLAEEIFKLNKSNIKDAKIRKWQTLKKKFNRLD